MELLTSLDPSERGPNNEAMFKRAGKRVAQWRRQCQPPMSQEIYAGLAGVSIGCLQGFELGSRTTRKQNVAKIAKVMHLTAEQLLADDLWPQGVDPRIQELDAEDVEMARAYHHSGADTKYALNRFFDPAISPEWRKRLARILQQLLKHPDALTHVDAFLRALEEPSHEDASKQPNEKRDQKRQTQG